ncbi:MAG: DUF2935 domain-containing protein, partial [Eubacteriales bacterium]
MPDTIEINIKQENMFWLQIMGDHARFIFNTLSPGEKVEIDKAEKFIKVFDDLLLKINAVNLASAEQVTQFNQEAAKAALQMRIFQLHLISRMLTQGILIDLTTVMINHFERETNEYLFLLNYYEKYNSLKLNPMRLHLVWLNDFMGHSAFVQNSIDYVYKELREQA